jgi:Uri superfamily endonuclease
LALTLKTFFETFLSDSSGSEKQKAGTERVVRFLIEKKRDQWDMLQKKYDPENIYYQKYQTEAKARGIAV